MALVLVCRLTYSNASCDKLAEKGAEHKPVIETTRARCQSSGIQAGCHSNNLERSEPGDEDGQSVAGVSVFCHDQENVFEDLVDM